MKKIVLFIALLILCSTIAEAQRRPAQRKLFRNTNGRAFDAKLICMPSNSIDSINLYLLFRFTNDLLGFELSTNIQGALGKYYSAPVVEVLLKNEHGIIKKSQLWRDTVYYDDFDETNSAVTYNTGYMTLKLPSGSYLPTIYLHDQYMDKIKTISNSDTIRGDYYFNELISKPVFVHKSDNDDNLQPFILESGLTFRSGGGRAFCFVSYTGVDEFEYSYRFMGRKDNFLSWSDTIYREGTLKVQNNLALSMTNGSFALAPLSEDNEDMKWGLISFNIPESDIRPGDYLLKINHKGSADTLSKEFNVIWENMPFILQKPEMALRTMYYILTDEEFDRLDSGSDSDISHAIIEYWRKQDPTPDTEYNEAMAEYFSRVDYAYNKYKTIAENNGALTGRGKIFILNGPPTKTERSFKGDKTREYWFYNNLKQIYEFEMVTDGIYKLKSIKPLKK